MYRSGHANRGHRRLRPDRLGPLPALRSAGHEPVALVRREPSGPDEIGWDIEAGTIDLAALEDVGAIVHLAGENIGQRWTSSVKRRVLESRVDGTRTIAEAVAARLPRLPCSCAPRRSGSTATAATRVVDESSPRGRGFLAEVVEAWEAAADPARDAGVRTVHLRHGIVLARHGGALQRLLLPFKLGVGGRWEAASSGGRGSRSPTPSPRIGTPSSSPSRGRSTSTAPSPVTNAEFVKALGRALHRPTVCRSRPSPSKAGSAQMGQEMLLEGQRALPDGSTTPASRSATRHRLRPSRSALAALIRSRYARSVSDEHDVIVVGAGAAGLACAQALARRGARLSCSSATTRSGDAFGPISSTGSCSTTASRCFPSLSRGEGCSTTTGSARRRSRAGRSSGSTDVSEGSPTHGRPGARLRALAGGVVGVRDGAAVLKLLRGSGEETTMAEAFRRQASRARPSERFLRRSFAGSCSRTLDDVERFLDFVLQGRSPTGLRRSRRRGWGRSRAQLADGLDVRTGTAVTAVGPGLGVARDRRAAAGDGRRRRHDRHCRRAGPRLERRHLRLLRRAADADSRAVARRQRRRGPDQQSLRAERGGPSYAPDGSLARLAVDPRGGRAGSRGGRAPAARLVRQRPSTEWRHLRSYRIPRALPSYPVGGFGTQPVRLADGLYACGDHREHPSLNGALASGRRAADAVLADGA